MVSAMDKGGEMLSLLIAQCHYVFLYRDLFSGHQSAPSAATEPSNQTNTAESMTGATSEHRFQLILGVELTNDKKLLNSVYAEDRKEHPDIRMYTLQPANKFVLSRLFSANGQARLLSFPGTVFRGHLERGGTP